MTTTPPPSAPKYALREADYDSSIPALLNPRDLGQVTDKGLLYMIYRETRRTRVILQVYFVLFLIWASLAVVAGVIALLAAGGDNGY